MGVSSSELEKAISDPAHLKQLGKQYSCIPTDFASVLSKYMLMSSDPSTAFKGKLGVRKRVAWTDPMPLDKIKTVGRAINTATLNDVLIATVTGAMRRYLKSRNTRVNELDLRVTVPINIRKPGTEFELGNKFSLVFLPLPVHLEDPILRLKEVKRRMDRLKTSPDPLINFVLLSAMGYLPPMVAKRASDQEFEREVMRPAGLVLVLQAPGVAPVAHDPVANGVGERLVQIEIVAAQEAAKMVFEVVADIATERLLVPGQRRHVGQDTGLRVVLFRHG